MKKISTKRIGTVCFIIEDKKVLLALIEYSKTDEKWNGIGGFVEPNETPEDAVVREISEETFIKVSKNDLTRVKELDLDMRLIIFKTNKWSGRLKTKDPSLKELKWFGFNEIPYGQMHKGNSNWIPELLK